MNLDLYKHKQYVIVLDAKDFENWKSGKCLARQIDAFDRTENIIDNTVSRQLDFAFEDSKAKADEFNIKQIYDMFEDETADKITKEYKRGEYGAHTKYNDRMFITYEEFQKGLNHYGTQAYVHTLDDVNKTLIIYTIK